ncbi:minor tail protein [Arthrobacter phage Eileen]|uniref:Minor tail protein n=2 Tax=Bridgettevirus TaxID=2733170 RepID=A0A3G2KI89_9CAUD|nr:minor tail protein [Arthrobacter phage Eileen]YP_009815569.1 minor tail protein [Arthrobacter phage Peas]AYN57808.1 minor tail protein [Arthrobacter phage Eileen]AYN58706.1 minor tail protein [Arthrobacter phage Peas]
MVAVVAEALLDDPCPRVGLTITGLGVGDSLVSVWRTADGERNPVRGARRITIVDAGFVTDYDAPLGRPVFYEVEVISGPGGPSRTLTPTMTVESPTGWLMDPLVPQSAVPIVGGDGDEGPYLRGEALAQLEYAADVSLINIMGSDKPMALFGQRMAARGVPLSLGAQLLEHNVRLRQLLMSNAQLLFRPLPDFGDLPGTMFVSIPSAVETPVDVAEGSYLTWWDLKADTVAAPVLKVLTATFTYGDVALLFATYQQKQDGAAGKTYLDDLKNPFD